MQQTETPIDVFISYKSADLPMARQLFYYLKEAGLHVFEANETLPLLGNADYRKTIDAALDRCQHLIVVGSSVENITSDWVEAEWGYYINEKRSGRKKGNILTVIAPGVKIETLPPSLRGYEVISYKEESFERIAAYVGRQYQDARYKPPKKRLQKSRVLLGGLAVAGLAALIFLFIKAYKPEINKPFDVAIFMAAAPNLKLHTGYPAFEGGELTVFLDNQAEKKRILPNQEVVLRQIPPAFRGKKVAAKLQAANWDLADDSIVLTQTIHLPIKPDGSLASVYGNVRNSKGEAVADCRIMIDEDTTIVSNSEGIFRAVLPYPMQKMHYQLSVSKQGYAVQRLDYYPVSGNIDIVINK